MALKIYEAYFRKLKFIDLHPKEKHGYNSQNVLRESNLLHLCMVSSNHKYSNKNLLLVTADVNWTSSVSV